MEGAFKTKNEFFNNKDNLEKFVSDKIFEIKAAGTTYIDKGQELLEALSTKNSDIIEVEFEREPDNKFDKNAIKIYLSVDGISGKRKHMGYVPATEAVGLSKVMDSGLYLIQILEVKVIGGWKLDVSNYGLRVKYKVVKREV